MTTVPRALLPLLMAVLLTGPLPAAAAKETKATQADGSTQSKAKRQRVVRPKVVPGGSGENAAERDRRLQRECRNMRNAGACLGYGI
ncbi:hypothetical protein AAFF27_19835 [Xylophilus sp. GW821-FHT01B05]